MPEIDYHQESLYRLLCGANSDNLDGMKLSCGIDHITWSRRKRKTGVVYEVRLWKTNDCKYVVRYYVNTWDYTTTYSITIHDIETDTSINSEYGSSLGFRFRESSYDKFREQFKSVTSLDPHLFES